MDLIRHLEEYFMGLRLSSLSRCVLLNRGDVGIIDEAFANYVAKVLIMCTPMRSRARLGDLSVALPTLVRCGDSIILPRLLMLPNNLVTHIVEALLTASLLGSEVELNYFAKSSSGNIDRGRSVIIKPHWGLGLLDTVRRGIAEGTVTLKTIDCGKCPMVNKCPYNKLGENRVVPGELLGIIEAIRGELLGEKPKPTHAEPVDYLLRVSRWAREMGRTWTSVGVGECPRCGKEGTVIVRTRGKEDKLIYRHRGTMCTVGSLREVTNIKITKYLEIVDE